jgi:hypothetical protein
MEPLFKLTKEDYAEAKHVTHTYASLEEAIEKAKQVVVRSYDGERLENRPWLEGSVPDSYGSPSYRTTILVREGSPPKGYVIIMRASMDGDTVLALGVYGEPLHRWSVEYRRPEATS